MFSRIDRAWIFPGLMIPVALMGLIMLVLPDETSSPTAKGRPQASATADATSVAGGQAEPPRRVGPSRSSVAPVESRRLYADLRAHEGARAKLDALDHLLDRSPEPQAVTILERLLRHPLKARTPKDTETFRLGVIARLGTYETPQASARLAALAARIEGDLELRLAALNALRRQRHDAATTRVLRALAERDADMQVRERAREVLSGAS